MRNVLGTLICFITKDPTLIEEQPEFWLQKGSKEKISACSRRDNIQPQNLPKIQARNQAGFFPMGINNPGKIPAWKLQIHIALLGHFTASFFCSTNLEFTYQLYTVLEDVESILGMLTFVRFFVGMSACTAFFYSFLSEDLHNFLILSYFQLVVALLM